MMAMETGRKAGSGARANQANGAREAGAGHRADSDSGKQRNDLEI
jgi:hypothetical protein